MMKKYGILTLLAICVLYTAFCFFSPRNFRIQKEVQIVAPPSLTFYLLNNLVEWPKWISWKEEDPAIDISMGGRDVNVGGYFTFKSSTLGKGYIELRESFKDSLVAARIVSSALPAPLQVSYQMVAEKNRSIYVTLRAGLEKGIPFWKRGYYSGLEKIWSKRLENDLEGLKNEMEASISGRFGIKQSEFPGKKFIGIRNLIPVSKIPSFYGKSYRKIYGLMDSLKIEVAGPPCGIIMEWDAIYNQVYIMAAIPISLDNKISRVLDYDIIEISKAPCLKLENFGPYSTLRNAHSKLDYFVENTELKIVSPFIEEYVTDPSEEPDTTKWQTNIYYLLNTGKEYMKGLAPIETQEDVDRENAERADREMKELERMEKLKEKKNKK